MTSRDEDRDYDEDEDEADRFLGWCIRLDRIVKDRTGKSPVDDRYTENEDDKGVHMLKLNEELYEDGLTPEKAAPAVIAFMERLERKEHQ